VTTCTILAYAAYCVVWQFSVSRKKTLDMNFENEYSSVRLYLLIVYHFCK